jgi:hypothetical protein
VTPLPVLAASLSIGALQLADSAGTDVNIADVLNYAQYGLLGIFVVLILRGAYVVPKYSLTNLKEGHERELKVKDELIESLRSDLRELKAANNDLQRLTSEKMIPALVQATAVSQAYVAELAQKNRGPDKNQW